MGSVSDLFDAYFAAPRRAELEMFGQETRVHVLFDVLPDGRRRTVIEGLSGELPYAIQFDDMETRFFEQGEDQADDAIRADATLRADPPEEHGARIFLLFDPLRVLAAGDNSAFTSGGGTATASLSFDLGDIAPTIPSRSLAHFGLADIDANGFVTLGVRPTGTPGPAVPPSATVVATDNEDALISFQQSNMPGRPTLRFQ